MNRLTVAGPIRRLLLNEKVWWLLPTPATLYMNAERLREPAHAPDLPDASWSRHERRMLLPASEERLRNIEGKGPGLATVSAVVVAAILLAITGGWDDSALPGRVLLILAAAYSALSLAMPVYLVGPVRRDTVNLAEIAEAAAAGDDPEEALAVSAAEAAMRNDLRNLQLTNLLDAARRELAYALILIVVWLLLVPVIGAFEA